MNLYEDDRDDERYSEKEYEDEKSNGDRSVYINRNLIFSDRYIAAIKTLGESRQCSKKIVDAARKMLEHHHGDKYEDLYFVDSVTNKMLSRTDYRADVQEVLPTKEMKIMAMSSPNIISMHNHPADTLPSYEDLFTCYKIAYKYGLVVCHDGDIYKYQTIGEPIKDIINPESSIYYKNERAIADDLQYGKITEQEFSIEHQKNFIKLASTFVIANVIITEVLWNGKPEHIRNEE